MEESIEVEGTVVTVLPGTSFRVRLDNNHEILAHISGRLRKNFIKVGVGDRVKMEMSPYDFNQARICYRLKQTVVQSQPPKRSFGPRHNNSSSHRNKVQ